MSRTRGLHRLVAAVALGAASILVSHTQATSTPAPPRVPFHLELLRSEPAVSDTVAMSPKQLKLWFSESIELKGTRRYTVTWRAAGDDGHPSTGKFSFHVK